MKQNIDMCFDYLSKMLATSLTEANNKGFPYIMVKYDILNVDGIVNPVFDYVPIKNLHDIVRLVNMGVLDITGVTIFDSKTGVEVDKSTFTK